MKQDMHILLVEDNKAFALAITKFLEKQTIFQVTLKTVDSVQAAVDLAKQEPFDAVLLDLSVTDSNGLDTLRRFHQAMPMLPVIVLTAYEDESMSLKALQEGAQDYLPKSDLGPRSLSRSILYAIERSRLTQQRDSFVSTIIHDLQNPLVGSERLLDLILSRQFGNLPENLEEIAKLLKQSNETMSQLLKNLLDVYRYEFRGAKFSFEKVDLGVVMRHSLEQIKPLAEVKSLHLVTEIPEDRAKINADSVAIKRVFLNLLGNSIKFTDDGGTVAISLKTMQDMAQVTVQDNGDGIPADEQRFLFQRFYQSTSGRKHAVGTGLGLYVCRQIIEAHGGTIDCHSTQGRGTSFVVTLPLAPKHG